MTNSRNGSPGIRSQASLEDDDDDYQYDAIQTKGLNRPPTPVKDPVRIQQKKYAIPQSTSRELSQVLRGRPHERDPIESHPDPAAESPEWQSGEEAVHDTSPPNDDLTQAELVGPTAPSFDTQRQTSPQKKVSLSPEPALGEYHKNLANQYGIETNFIGHIAGRMFNIPLAQQDLLNSEASWYPSLFGEPAGGGTVPSPLLRALTTEADRVDSPSSNEPRSTVQDRNGQLKKNEENENAGSENLKDTSGPAYNTTLSKKDTHTSISALPSQREGSQAFSTKSEGRMVGSGNNNSNLNSPAISSTSSSVVDWSDSGSDTSDKNQLPPDSSPLPLEPHSLTQSPQPAKDQPEAITDVTIHSAQSPKHNYEGPESRNPAEDTSDRLASSAEPEVFKWRHQSSNRKGLSNALSDSAGEVEIDSSPPKRIQVDRTPYPLKGQIGSEALESSTFVIPGTFDENPKQPPGHSRLSEDSIITSTAGQTKADNFESDSSEDAIIHLNSASQRPDDRDSRRTDSPSDQLRSELGSQTLREQPRSSPARKRERPESESHEGHESKRRRKSTSPATSYAEVDDARRVNRRDFFHSLAQKHSRPPTSASTPTSRKAGSTRSTTDNIKGGDATAELYVTFRKAYPEYKGKPIHFEAACQLLQSSRAKAPIHPSLWDAFVFRHYHDYRHYLQEVIETCGTAMPYTEFLDTIEDLGYHKRVISTKTLEDRSAESMHTSVTGGHEAGQSTPTSLAGQTSMVIPGLQGSRLEEQESPIIDSIEVFAFRPSPKKTQIQNEDQPTTAQRDTGEPDAQHTTKANVPTAITATDVKRGEHNQNNKVGVSRLRTPQPQHASLLKTAQPQRQSRSRVKVQAKRPDPIVVDTVFTQFARDYNRLPGEKDIGQVIQKSNEDGNGETGVQRHFVDVFRWTK